MILTKASEVFTELVFQVIIKLGINDALKIDRAV